MIYILTGAIRTGKTTTLLEWSEKRDDVDGLLCPDGENGKRDFLKVKSQEEFELEVEALEKREEVIEIGSFKFLKAAFKKANDYLISIAFEARSQYIIMDEIGKLELKNEGLHLSAETLISKYMHDKQRHLILVVRDYLLEDILKHYVISKYSVLKKEGLEMLK